MSKKVKTGIKKEEKIIGCEDGIQVGSSYIGVGINGRMQILVEPAQEMYLCHHMVPFSGHRIAV